MKTALLIAGLLAMDGTRMSLLNLKSHWTGNGVSHFAHDVLRLLSSKLRAQCGQISSYLPLPGGPNWTLNAVLSLRCREGGHAGVSLLLTPQGLVQPHKDYSCEGFGRTFGAFRASNGIAITLFKDTLYVAYIEDDLDGWEQLVEWGTPCKAGLGADRSEAALTLRYRAETLSVYIFDALTRTETLCRQFVGVDFLEEFYLTAAGSADRPGCSGAVTQADFAPAAAPAFVAEEFKQPGTPQFAVLGNFTSRAFNAQHFQRAYALHRQNAKILAAELLGFADKNEKEVAEDLAAAYAGHLANLTAALGAIERETAQLSALSALLLGQRETAKQASGDVLGNILVWLNSAEQVYAATTNSTRRIYASVKEARFDAQLRKMLNHTEKILAGLKGVFRQAVEGADGAELDGEWHERLANFTQKFNATVKGRVGADPSATLQRLGVLLLSGLAGMIFLAFAFLYWKVRRAAEFKRIL